MSTAHRKLARSAGTIGGLTAVSRVLGFIRDLVIAKAFGTGVGAEAFVVSFKLPNLLRDLVGEGAANAAFVPVLTECREKRPEAFWRLVTTLFLAMSLVLLALALAGVLFAPSVVAVLAPGFVDSADAEKFPLTVRLTRLMFPYIFLIGLSALAMGVLHSLREFTSSAAGPVLLNLSMIAAGFWFEDRYGPVALVGGVLAGGVLQLACQIPPLLKSGFRFARPSLGDGYAARIAKLLVPRALGSAVYQVNVFVDSILASFERVVGAGGQSALYYSNRLFQLPLAIFAISLAQAVLPTFSAQAARGESEAFKDTLRMSLRTLVFASLPAAVGLAVLAEPIVRIIFERGRFDSYSTAITSNALFYYAFGLVSCCLIKILVNAFYALQDTRTPVKTMFLSVGVNVGFSLALMKPLGIGGLTLASSVSATLNAALLYRGLSRRIGPLGFGALAAASVPMAAAATLMGALCAAAGATVLAPGALPGGWAPAALAATVAAGVCVYAAACAAFGVPEMRKVLSWRKSRRA